MGKLYHGARQHLSALSPRWDHTNRFDVVRSVSTGNAAARATINWRSSLGLAQHSNPTQSSSTLSTRQGAVAISDGLEDRRVIRKHNCMQVPQDCRLYAAAHLGEDPCIPAASASSTLLQFETVVAVDCNCQSSRQHASGLTVDTVYDMMRSRHRLQQQCIIDVCYTTPAGRTDGSAGEEDDCADAGGLLLLLLPLLLHEAEGRRLSGCQQHRSQQTWRGWRPECRPHGGK